MYSQGAGLSQLSCDLSGNVCMEPLESQREAEGDLLDRSVKIIKENVSITFESRLKHIEKKRLNFQSKIKKQVDEKERLLDLHKQRKKLSVDLQMNIEEISEKYQSEISERKLYLDRSKYYFAFVDIFKEHHSKAKAAEQGIDQDGSKFISGFENCLSNDILIDKKKEAIKQSFSLKIDKEISKTRANREDIIDKRGSSVNVIKTYAVKNDDAGNKNEFAMEKVNARVKDEGELLNTYNELKSQIQSDFEEVPKLQQQLNELMMFRSACTQNSKLQLNTDQNINANLGGKYTEREDSLNTAIKKRKELNNLTLQLKLAVEDFMKCRDAHNKKREEYITQKCDLKNKSESLGEGIHKLKDIKDLNKSIKTDVLAWEEKIKLNNGIIFEVDELLNYLQNELENKNKALCETMRYNSDCEAGCKDLQNDENELNIKIEELKIINHDERQGNLLRNKNMEEKNTLTANEMKITDIDNKKIEDSIFGLHQEINTTKLSIQKLEDEAIQNIENLQCRHIDLEEEIKSLLNNIASKKYEDENFDITICEAIPLQEELPDLISSEATLMQATLDQHLSYQQELNEIHQLFNAKILTIEKEMELHASVVDSLIKAEEEATNKMKVEIKATEDTKMALEQHISYYQSQISMLKINEQQKRMSIVRTEKKLRTINKEVKVTREDISDAIIGKQQAPKRMQQRSTKLMTPTSSNSVSNLKEPPIKKMGFSSNSRHLSQVQSQMTTKRRMESVPDDEYDFSEWNQ